MNVKKTLNLLNDPYLWYTAIILVIVVILTYVFEQQILGLLADSNQWHQVFMTIRNFLLLGAVILSSWRFGFKGGLATSTIIALILLPHVLTETFSEANNSESLLEYAIFVPFGILFSWLIGFQKQTEKRLADSEIRYRRLFETAQDAILILNGDTGQIIDANPFIKDLLGLSIEEFIGNNIWEIGEFKDTLASKISYQELHDSGYKRWDNLPLVTKDGRVISVEVVANAYQVDHTPVIQCNIRDMTVADMAGKTLRNVKKDLEVAQHLTRIGSWKWIISTNKTTWSEELCRILGYDMNAPVPPFAEMEKFYTPNSWKRLNELVTRAFNTGEPYELEVAEIRTDGTIINTITRGEADIDENGKIISLHGTVQDVTEQRRSERETATILRTAMDGFYIVDTQGRILDTNYAYCSMIGYSREELLHMKVADIEAVDTDEVIKQKIQQIMGTGHARFETKHKRKDGGIIDIEASVNYLGESEPKLFCFVRDITERKKAQQTLGLQSSLLDAELDSVYLLDLAGHILYANKAACLSHGYTKEELQNMNLNQLDDPESANLITPRIEEILGKGHGTFNINHRRKDGSLIPMEIHTSLVENDHKQLLLSVARDTTERRNLQEQLMSQDRLVSIGQLVSGVAHEINNPLTSVIGFSELLLKRDLPQDAKDDLKIVNDEAKRTALIVKNLLTFARKQPEGKMPVNINEQLQRVVALRIHEQKINNIQVNLSLAPDLPQIIGNASQLQQVFFNIITNAEQAMLEAHNKGIITITAEQVDNIVKVSFADDGPGISLENMKKLFTPFFTTKGVGKGTGLGLSICHGIVTEHGGRIYAESEPGNGTSFIVELPINVLQPLKK